LIIKYLQIRGVQLEPGVASPRYSSHSLGMTHAGRFILHCYDELGSTMDKSRALAEEGAPDGTVVMARRQTAGRGRQGRGWFSPAGNLHATVLLRPELPAARLAELGFVAALAVAEAADATLTAPRTRLKWPNDVLVDGSKIAGILVELPGDGVVLIGIGVNVVHAPVAELYPATSLHALGAEANPEGLLRHILTVLASELTRWQTQGFAPVRLAWLARGPAPGEAVRLRLGQEIVNACFADLDADGALLIADAAGCRRVTAGEVLLSAR
jgi:BirA family transcriptional regulator, biotin operon repressor / biotin---[acetyl-CoA-carboxylase] ligase